MARKHPGSDDLLKLLYLMKQLDPMEQQKESDRRWEKMCDWVSKHPEQEAKTMGDYSRLATRFGFRVPRKLSPKEEKREGNFPQFVELIGGALQCVDGDYEMKHAAQPPRKCEKCGQPTIKSCVKCNAPYCCRECQVQDWKSHKPVCRAIQDAQTF